MIRKIISINSVIVVLLAAAFVIYPCIRAVLNIQDPALRQPGIPKAAWRLYRNLTPRYMRWAQNRVAQGRAAGMSISDISGTE
jgi:hypothetical protein